ncbi:MAG: hypothetical protein KatS3mg043_0654 [Rhodothermaceae bacterium]|nr:MAG: hypothetical protein KatS3mg043_0654 [Rhodothermaceae bacterium]
MNTSTVLRRVPAALFLWLGLIVPAAAQPAVRFYGHAGSASPVGPNSFVDFWETGLQAGAGVGFRVFGQAEAVIGVDYRRFPLEKDEFLADAGVLGLDLRLDGGGLAVLSGTFRLKANLEASDRFAPYVAAGFGLYRRTLDRLTVSAAGEHLTLPGESETTLGLEGAVGVGVILSSRLQVFAEPAFTFLANSFEKPAFNRDIDRTEDNNMRFLMVRLGVVLGR